MIGVRFIDPKLREFAYGDHPLPIAEDQTISQPYMVAVMIQALELEPHDRVLEVGTGSGYGAAILGEMVRFVPLVGSQGWEAPTPVKKAKGLLEQIREEAEPFESVGRGFVEKFRSEGRVWGSQLMGDVEGPGVVWLDRTYRLSPMFTVG